MINRMRTRGEKVIFGLFADRVYREALGERGILGSIGSLSINHRLNPTERPMRIQSLRHLNRTPNSPNRQLDVLPYPRQHVDQSINRELWGFLVDHIGHSGPGDA